MLRLAATCAAGLICLTGLAAPSAAAQDLLPPADGTYSYSEPGQPAATWEMSTVCIQPNGTRAQQDYHDITIQTLGCTTRIGSSTVGRVTQEERLLSTGGDARLTGGLWTFSNYFYSGRDCPDGRKVPVTSTFAFDAATLLGTRTTTWGDECGDPPGMTKTQFTLRFLEPMDPPMVNRFPDRCDYLVGRPSICS